MPKKYRNLLQNRNKYTENHSTFKEVSGTTVSTSEI